MPGRSPMTDKRVVLVTCSSTKEAKRIARAVVEARLAACGNILAASVESIFRWNGKVEQVQEALLILKTTRTRFGRLQAAVRRLHSYDVPEIIALPIAEGFGEYLKWIADSTSLPAVKKRRSR
jgi:periplasmic divalent cation tolerance protein